LNIASIQVNLGATWGADNVIVVAPVNRTVLHRVPAAGGTPEPITTLNVQRKENSHRWPHFLPDGRHFLFTARSDVKENNLVYVGSVDSKDVKALVAAQSNAVYVSPGYLVYARDATLMAQRFDVAALSLAGEAMPVAASVAHSTASSSAAFGACRRFRTGAPSGHHSREPGGWTIDRAVRGRRSDLNGPTPRFDSRRTRSSRRSSSPIPTAATAISGCSSSRTAVSPA
jgi:hypothetical protein